MSWRGARYVAIANFDSICLCHSLDRAQPSNGSSNGSPSGSSNGSCVLELSALLSSWGWRHVLHIFEDDVHDMRLFNGLTGASVGPSVGTSVTSPVGDGETAFEDASALGSVLPALTLSNTSSRRVVAGGASADGSADADADADGDGAGVAQALIRDLCSWQQVLSQALSVTHMGARKATLTLSLPRPTSHAHGGRKSLGGGDDGGGGGGFWALPPVPPSVMESLTITVTKIATGGGAKGKGKGAGKGKTRVLVPRLRSNSSSGSGSNGGGRRSSFDAGGGAGVWYGESLWDTSSHPSSGDSHQQRASKPKHSHLLSPGCEYMFQLVGERGYIYQSITTTTPAAPPPPPTLVSLTTFTPRGASVVNEDEHDYDNAYGRRGRSGGGSGGGGSGRCEGNWSGVRATVLLSKLNDRPAQPESLPGRDGEGGERKEGCACTVTATCTLTRITDGASALDDANGRESEGSYEHDENDENHVANANTNANTSLANIKPSSTKLTDCEEGGVSASTSTSESVVATVTVGCSAAGEVMAIEFRVPATNVNGAPAPVSYGGGDDEEEVGSGVVYVEVPQVGDTDGVGHGAVDGVQRYNVSVVLTAHNSAGSSTEVNADGPTLTVFTDTPSEGEEGDADGGEEVWDGGEIDGDEGEVGAGDEAAEGNLDATITFNSDDDEGGDDAGDYGGDDLGEDDGWFESEDQDGNPTPPPPPPPPPVPSLAIINSRDSRHEVAGEGEGEKEGEDGPNLDTLRIKIAQPTASTTTLSTVNTAGADTDADAGDGTGVDGAAYACSIEVRPWNPSLRQSPWYTCRYTANTKSNAADFDAAGIDHNAGAGTSAGAAAFDVSLAAILSEINNPDSTDPDANGDSESDGEGSASDGVEESEEGESDGEESEEASEEEEEGDEEGEGESESDEEYVGFGVAKVRHTIAAITV